MSDAWINGLFLAVTGFIAWHALRRRRPPPDGEPSEDETVGQADTVRLLFGCIAALFFVVVLFRDVLGLNLF